MKALLLTVFIALGLSLQAAEPKAPFTLAIVPSQSGPDWRMISTAKKNPEPFYVVLTNTSAEAQSTWVTSCSWGYQTISFAFKMPDGRQIILSKKRDTGFTVNFPHAFLVPPGESQVYPIRLDSEWENRPRFDNSDEIPVKVTAIYEVTPTPDSTRLKVWTGRIESPEYNFRLAHW